MFRIKVTLALLLGSCSATDPDARGYAGPTSLLFNPGRLTESLINSLQLKDLFVVAKL